jgi:glycosyltransferase involved in cell wall biosynthesis
MKNLLVICHGFPPYYGGAENAAYYLAREAAADGVAVTVVTSDIGGRLPPEDDHDGIRVVRLPVWKRRWTRHTVFELAHFRRVACRGVPAIADAVKPDYILAHFTLPAGDVARRLGAARGIPFGVVLHGSDVPGYQPRRFGLLYPLVRPCVRAVWQSAHRRIAVSRPLAALARQTWPGGEIDVVGNGVDTLLFSPAGRTNGDRPLSMRLLVVAQLVRRKGLQYLADALLRLPEVIRVRASVEIYGTGPEELMLRRRFGRTGVPVAFKGVVASEDLATAFREADLFVLPSLEEGLPLALLEAMASGLPVVAAAVGGIPSIVQHGENGLLVQPAAERPLVEALELLASDPDRRRRLGEAARRTAEHHGWDRVWRRYRQVMEGGAAPREETAP